MCYKLCITVHIVDDILTVL